MKKLLIIAALFIGLSSFAANDNSRKVQNVYNKQGELVGTTSQMDFDKLPKDAIQEITSRYTYPTYNLKEAQNRAGALAISPEDIMRTLNAFSAETIVEALKRSFKDSRNVVVYSSGGGMHNPLLMTSIKNALPDFKFFTTQDVNIHPDAKEAVLFAILANETVAGGSTVIGGGRKDIPAVSMGKISFPG